MVDPVSWSPLRLRPPHFAREGLFSILLKVTQQIICRNMRRTWESRLSIILTVKVTCMWNMGIHFA